SQILISMIDICVVCEAVARAAVSENRRRSAREVHTRAAVTEIGSAVGKATATGRCAGQVAISARGARAGGDRDRQRSGELDGDLGVVQARSRAAREV